MQQSPSREANDFLARQETPGILWNPKIHHCKYKSLSFVPILSPISQVHDPIPFF